MDLKEVYNEVSKRGLSRFVNGGYVYKGIKFFEDKVLCTDKEFYEDITDFFMGFDSLDQAISEHLKSKYINKINAVEEAIKNEVNGNNNYNRYNWLKSERDHYINKYNEQVKKRVQREF
jgi:hypothetical protein